LAELLQSQAAFDAGTITVEEVHIYSSELTPKGSLYTVMGRAGLGEKKETSP
jgi:2'-5' RNA ligase